MGKGRSSFLSDVKQLTETLNCTVQDYGPNPLWVLSECSLAGHKSNQALGKTGQQGGKGKKEAPHASRDA